MASRRPAGGPVHRRGAAEPAQPRDPAAAAVAATARRLAGGGLPVPDGLEPAGRAGAPTAGIKDYDLFYFDGVRPVGAGRGGRRRAGRCLPARSGRHRSKPRTRPGCTPGTPQWFGQPYAPCIHRATASSASWCPAPVSACSRSRTAHPLLYAPYGLERLVPRHPAPQPADRPPRTVPAEGAPATARAGTGCRSSRIDLQGQGPTRQCECLGTSAPRQPTRKSKSQPSSACSTRSIYSCW